jgi:hypothetical protein
MSNVERGVVKAPNLNLHDLGAKRSMTPTSGASATHSPDRARGGAEPGGCGSLTKSASPVSTPDHRFNVDQAKMPQPSAATMPGQGAVPVDLRVGLPASGIARRDSAKK